MSIRNLIFRNFRTYMLKNLLMIFILCLVVIPILQEASPNTQNYSEAFSYLLGSMELLQEKQRNTASELEKARISLVHNYIDRYLHTPVSALADGDLLPEIPDFPAHYVVGYAAVNISGANLDSTDLHLLTMMVGSKLSTELNALLHQSNNFSFTLIIPALSDYDRQILRLRQLVDDLSSLINLPVCLALSHVCEGITQLNAAYEAARSVMSAHGNAPGVHLPGAERNPLFPSRFDSRHLYDAVLEANYPLSCEILDDLMSNAYAYLDLEQRFKYARILLRMAAHVLIPESELKCPRYSCYLTPEQLTCQLRDFALSICRAAANRSEYLADVAEQQSIQRSKERILRYINERFVCDDLSIQSICDDCEISEKLLNEICHASVGTSASAYIRQLRMEKASFLLRNTDIKVIDILKNCGYNTPNAFANVR